MHHDFKKNKRKKGKDFCEMTIEEKRIQLDEFCASVLNCENCPLFVDELKCGRGEHFNVKEGRMSDADIDLAYGIVFGEDPAEPEKPHIRDSGSRREFETGAVRDISDDKGRCDLLPLDVVAQVLGGYYGEPDAVLDAVSGFVKSGSLHCLFDALEFFRNMWGIPVETMFLEVAKHFAEGAKKYGEYNWQKGIPARCYIDSAVRHYLKFLRGDTDEPHDRAFVWNVICCIWTCIHKPELNEYGKDGDTDVED
jgi:hypothetical protein